MPNNSHFTPEQIQEILDLYFENFAHRQYIGARYVPIFGRKDEESIEWDNTGTYEPLTIVLYQGNSFTSRQFVPVGVEITNQTYWANTGNYNAQVEQYRQAVLNLSSIIPSNEFDGENTVKKYIDKGMLNTHCVDFYGADPTGVIDSSEAIAACIEACKGSTIYFNPGIYVITEPIETPHEYADRINIDFNGAIIKPIADMNYIIGIGYNNPKNYGMAGGIKTFFRNGNIINNRGHAEIGIRIRKFYKNSVLENMNVVNCKIGICIYEALATPDEKREPSDCQINNSMILNDNSFDTNTIGINIEGTDNKFSDIRIFGFFKSIVMNGSGLFLYDVHNLPQGAINRNDYSSYQLLEDSIFVEVNSSGIWLTNCYCDTTGIFAKLNGGPYGIYFSNCNMYSYLEPFRMRYIESNMNANNIIKLVNCVYNGRNTNDSIPNKSIIFKAANNASQIRSFKAINCVINNPEKIECGDMLAMSDKIYSYWTNDSYQGWMPITCIILPSAVNCGFIDIDITRFFSVPRKLHMFGNVTLNSSNKIVNMSNIIFETENFPEALGYNYIWDDDNNIVKIIIYLNIASANTRNDYSVNNNTPYIMTPPTSTDVQKVVNNITNFPGIDVNNVTTLRSV